MSDTGEQYDGTADEVEPDPDYVARRLRAIDERMARRPVDPGVQLTSSDDD